MAELRVKGTGTLKLFENDNTSSVTIASPASLGGDRTVTLPDADVTLVSGTMSTGFAVADITGQTALGAEPADTDEFVLSDAGVLKRVDYSYIKAANTPAFEAYMNATQTMSDNTETAVEFDTENFDTDGAFDTATYRFTPQTAGKYFVYTMVNVSGDANSDLQYGWCFIRKNGSKVLESKFDYRNGYGRDASTSVSQIVDLDGSTDYVDVYAGARDETGDPIIEGTQRFTVFGAYKLIGV